jgi:serine/threonine protein kinase
MEDYLNYFNNTDDIDYNLTQKGGELLDKGGYGCVFYPSINCRTGKENKNNKYISKLQIENKVSNNEYNISKLIKKIDNYNRYFIPIENKCYININKLEDKVVNSCDILDGKRKGKREIVMMKSKYIENKIFLEYFNGLDKNKKVFHFIEFYKNLLSSIEKLQSINLIHFDLKGDNILIDLKNEIPLIIDFGLTINIDELNNDTVIDKLYYSPKHIYIPPEIQLLGYLYRNNLEPNEKTINMITKELFEELENKILVNYYSKDFINMFYQLFKNEMLKYKNKSKREILNIIKNEKYWKKIDIYSLGILYLKMFRYIFRYYNHPLILHLSSILLNNIHPNPLKRNTTNEIIESIENYMLINKDIDYQKLVDLVI